jgi:hypothetical protein
MLPDEDDPEPLAPELLPLAPELLPLAPELLLGWGRSGVGSGCVGTRGEGAGES